MVPPSLRHSAMGTITVSISLDPLDSRGRYSLTLLIPPSPSSNSCTIPVILRSTCFLSSKASSSYSGMRLPITMSISVIPMSAASMASSTMGLSSGWPFSSSKLDRRDTDASLTTLIPIMAFSASLHILSLNSDANSRYAVVFVSMCASLRFLPFFPNSRSNTTTG